MNIRKAGAIVIFLLAGVGAKGAGNGLSAEDVAKIKQVHSKYEEAWLRGDANAVRALLRRIACCCRRTRTKHESDKKA